jgi:hypothetical protein
MKLYIMQFFRASWYRLSHRFKHYPWHFVLKHSQYNSIANNSKLIYLCMFAHVRACVCLYACWKGCLRANENTHTSLYVSHPEALA